jgi:hypothetical protein
MAPLVIGVFFFTSLQMIFMGIVGEYIGAIHTFVQKRPLVFEKERINFQYDASMPVPDTETDLQALGIAVGQSASLRPPVMS